MEEYRQYTFSRIDKMAIVMYILGTIVSYWTWILLILIFALSVKWYLSTKKEVVDPFLEIPEIKPHWFWGNVGSIFGEDHFVAAYDKHYKVIRG